MRIISGIHKGRRLSAPKNLPVRPTTDRAKEALFNILGHEVYWPECSVLDLFSGTGNLSYECASRGCPRVVAVDAHAGCAKFIEQTARLLEIPVTVYKRDVNAFLKLCTDSFDLIFADPPYDFSQEQLGEVVALCFEKGLLKEDGILILEHSTQRDLSELQYFDSARKYGSTVFSFFRP
ncbi:RsmD family RNA methyltransferase [Robiginitalea sp.]|uniref:RsmD family RNA methyltransferase n=1 Tax=Robiginitalea sp. TaxID=1902411 RepID=UPI003C501448